MLGNHSTTELSLVPSHVLPVMQGSHEDVMAMTSSWEASAEEQTQAREPYTSHLTSLLSYAKRVVLITAIVTNGNKDLPSS